MTPLRCEVATTGAAVGALRPAWQSLWRGAPGASPFQSPAWSMAWWAAFGTGRPVVAALRAGDSLVGLLPLYVLEEAGARKLLPIGIGVSDYLDALLAPGVPPPAAGRLLRAALDAAPDAGVCDLTDLPPGSPLRGLEAPPGWRAAWRETDVCPVLRLPAAGEGLRGAVPAGTLRKLRMNRHRAARAGGAAVEVASRETAPGCLGELARLHAARWRGRGEPGVLADPRVRAFQAAAVPALAGEGALRLALLRLGGEVAAACYALLAGDDRILFYLSGFDAARAYESPGSLLLGHMLEEAAAEGRREAHFLRGGEAYKYAWGAVDRRNAACRLTRR